MFFGPKPATYTPPSDENRRNASRFPFGGGARTGHTEPGPVSKSLWRFQRFPRSRVNSSCPKIATCAGGARLVQRIDDPSVRRPAPVPWSRNGSDGRPAFKITAHYLPLKLVAHHPSKIEG